MKRLTTYFRGAAHAPAQTPGTVAARGARLHLRLPPGWPGSPAPLTGWRAGAPGSRATVADATSLSAEFRGQSVQIWTPSAETLLTQVSLPTRSRAKIEQALPYALEEQLLGDPAAQSLVWVADDDRITVAVTAKARMQAWMDGLKQAGIRPAAIAPAFFLVPHTPGAWSLVVASGEYSVRTGDRAGFSCLPDRVDLPPFALLAALREARDSGQSPSRLLIYSEQPITLSETWRRIVGLPVEHHPLADVAGIESPALSLMTREYRPGAGTQIAWRHYVPAAAAAALWLAGTLAFDIREWQRLERNHTASRAELTEVFRQAFPEARAIVDPALQMARNLKDLESRAGGAEAGDLLALLSFVAPEIRQRGATLRRIQYDQRQLTLDLVVHDYQAMAALREAFAARGLRADLLNAQSKGEQVEGRLRLAAGGLGSGVNK